MIGTMRKHSTWLWSIIIVVVVFAFVIWGTNPGQQGGGGPVGSLGRINGQPVTEEDYLSAQREVLLQYFLRTGSMPGSEAAQRGFDLQRETYQLLLLTQIMEERQIHAGPEAKATVAANILRSLQSQGINTLADFEQAMLRKEGLTLTDLDRFMEHQIGLQQLMEVEGISGELVTPEQIESFWRRENQEISAQAVFFSAADYLPSVEVTPEALGAFFTNQMARYRIPDRLQVAYVAFPITNHFAQVDERFAALTNLNEQIEAIYQQRGTNFYADLTPEQAREKILQDERRAQAVLAAREEAALFADELWQKEPMNPADMKNLAAAKGLTVRITEPFDRTQTPGELAVNSAFTQAAFRLREDEPYGGPIEGDEDVYVITLEQRIPSTNAKLEDVKEQVTQDYRLQQATLKARELGRTFTAELTNHLASGKTFAETSAAAGHQPVLLPPFAQSTRTLPAVEQHTSLGLFKQVAFATPEHTASGFNFTSDGGYVVYVDAKLPVDEAAMKVALPEYTRLVQQALATEAFNTWFSGVAQTGLQETPLNRAAPGELSAPVN